MSRVKSQLPEPEADYWAQVDADRERAQREYEEYHVRCAETMLRERDALLRHCSLSRVH